MPDRITMPHCFTCLAPVHYGGHQLPVRSCSPEQPRVSCNLQQAEGVGPVGASSAPVTRYSGWGSGPVLSWAEMSLAWSSTHHWSAQGQAPNKGNDWANWCLGVVFERASETLKSGDVDLPTTKPHPAKPKKAFPRTGSLSLKSFISSFLENLHSCGENLGFASHSPSQNTHKSTCPTVSFIWPQPCVGEWCVLLFHLFFPVRTVAQTPGPEQSSLWQEMRQDVADQEHAARHTCCRRPKAVLARGLTALMLGGWLDASLQTDKGDGSGVACCSVPAGSGAWHTAVAGIVNLYT